MTEQFNDLLLGSDEGDLFRDAPAAGAKTTGEEDFAEFLDEKPAAAPPAAAPPAAPAAAPEKDPFDDFFGERTGDTNF